MCHEEKRSSEGVVKALLGRDVYRGRGTLSMEGMAETEWDGGIEKSVHFLVSCSPLSSSLTGRET